MRRGHLTGGRSGPFRIIGVLIGAMALLGVATAASADELDIGVHDTTYTWADATRGFYFTAPVDFEITGLRVPTDTGTEVQNVEVVVFFSDPPLEPLGTNDFLSLEYQTDVPGTDWIDVSIPVQAGDVIGILGARGTTDMNTSYLATNTYDTTIAGHTVRLKRLRYDDNLNTTSAYDLSYDNSWPMGRVEMRYHAPCEPWSQELQTFGTEGFTANQLKLNVIEMTESAVLSDFDIYANSDLGSTLPFVVYEGVASSGTFNLIWAQDRTFVGSGWQNSGPVDLPLQAGMYYAIGHYAVSGSNYYYDNNNFASYWWGDFVDAAQVSATGAEAQISVGSGAGGYGMALQFQTICSCDGDGDGYDACDECDDDVAALNNDDADNDNWSTCEGDCDDNDADISPVDPEVLGNGIDDDCDLLVDEVEDAFGYSMVPGTYIGGICPSWMFNITSNDVDLLGSGYATAFTMPLGQEMDIYGDLFSSVRVATSGYVSTDPKDPGFDITPDCPLPASPSTGGGDRLYMLHDRLEVDPQHGGEIVYINHEYCPRLQGFRPATPCTMVRWINTEHWDANGQDQWNMIMYLYEDTGDIIFTIWDGNPERGSNSTTGIQNAEANDSLEWACDTPNSVPDYHSVCFFHPDAPVLDDDGDFLPDADDNCPAVFNPAQTNSDGDGWGDACDNCPLVYNPNQEDADNDGTGTACECDDSDPSLNYNDVDGDGEATCDGDCDDYDAAVYTAATELSCDYIDNNCDGALHPDEVDDDKDGYDECQNDCNDANGSINPGATEVCNYVDDDCDSSIDEGVTTDYYPDGDSDGYGDDSAAATPDCSAPSGMVANDGDCDDNNDQVHPGMTEDDCNGIDDDCDGALHPDEADVDNDGYGICENDCNDNNPDINPGAQEQCNGIDDNCNGKTDEGVKYQDFYPDGDGDGFGDPKGKSINDCIAPKGYVANSGDCNDANKAINPSAAEVACDGIDNDCDGDQHPEDVDDDKDGQTECEGDCDDTDPNLEDEDNDNDGASSCDGDCDDFNNTLNLDDADKDGATTCDGDCNDNDPTLNLDDVDFDKYDTCSGDCDDSDSQVNPGMTEVVCNGKDDDCDAGTEDEPDGDSDGYSECDDCDDNNNQVNPGVKEVECDKVDNDCDPATADEPDLDGDGFSSCVECDDTDNAVNPDADEVCDGIDNDCDGTIDVGATDELTWYEDADGDGFGDPKVNQDACDQPKGYVLDGTDCDDTLAAVNPDAVEVCNGVDDDCDPATDENTDYDKDGFTACDGDCDESDPAVNPDAEEICNDDVDDDCDPFTDEDVDGDGDKESICDGDCDDTNAAVNTSAKEICDGFDNDCDGALLKNEVDADNDGVMVCENDCDDTDPLTYPGAPEQCDKVDNDCDGTVDEDVGVDQDKDGYTPCDGDCDDADAAVNPGAKAELCDGKDTDCDGTTPADEVDADVDGYMVCDGDCDDADATQNLDDLDSDGYSTCTGDCVDTDASLNPADADSDGYSTCDLDCDDSDATLTPADNDLDGYSTCDGDCDDTTTAASPAGTEVCDGGIDNDCNGVADDVDADGDGYYDSACAGGDDCNDGDKAVNPGAAEVCDDGVDNDCDGDVDLMDDDCVTGDDDTGDDDTGDDDDTADDDTADDDTDGDDDDTAGQDTCECQGDVARTKPALHLAALLALLGLVAIRRRS